MSIKIKKIFLFLIILSNLIFFASPVFAACPQGKVAVIGDSLGKGIGDKLANGCPNVSVFAAKSAFTNDIINQFYNKVENQGYNTLIVMGGYNDTNAGAPANNALKNLQTIYSQAQDKQKMTVVALTVPAYLNDHANIVSEINIGIGRTGVKVINANEMWTSSSGNVHDTPSYIEVANAIKAENISPGQGINQTITPTATDVKATCAGIETLQEGQEGPPAPQSKEMTLTVQSTDQAKIEEEVNKACQAECADKKWEECSAEITSQQPSTGTGQVPDSDTKGTAPLVPAPPPPSFQRSSTLISGENACEMWKNAFNLGISFLGVAALIGIIWGGFNYITSYGNQERITSAKASIWGSIAGMLIGLLAYMLFSMINPYVLECKIEAPFKLSVSSSGITPRNGEAPGGNLIGAEVGSLGKCTKTYDPNNAGSHGYGQIIQAASQRFEVDPFFVESTIQHESKFSNEALSPAGARTMGQFIPNTFAAAAKKWGGEIEPSCLSPVGRQYTPACLKWIAENPKKIPEIVAAEIARIKDGIPSDNYACIAAGYVGGPGEAYNERTGFYSGGKAYCTGKRVDTGTTDYINNAAIGYNNSCQKGQ